MAYGPDAVHELVEESGWSYPVSANRIDREHALKNIQLDERGNFIMVGELLAAADADRFESREDLERTLGPACERESRARRKGILNRVKGFLLG